MLFRVHKNKSYRTRCTLHTQVSSGKRFLPRSGQSRQNDSFCTVLGGIPIFLVAGRTAGLSGMSANISPSLSPNKHCCRRQHQITARFFSQESKYNRLPRLRRGRILVIVDSIGNMRLNDVRLQNE